MSIMFAIAYLVQVVHRFGLPYLQRSNIIDVCHFTPFSDVRGQTRRGSEKYPATGVNLDHSPLEKRS